MKTVITISGLLLAASLVLGLWLQAIGVGSEGDGAAQLADELGLSQAYWPFIFPIFGLLISLAIGLAHYKIVERAIAAGKLEKSHFSAAAGIAFGAALAIFIQGFAGLEHFDLITKESALGVFAVLEFGFFIALGNYVSTVKLGATTGLRTPWSLRSDLAWKKTHRFLSRGIVLVSFAAFVLLLFAPPYTVIMTHLVGLISVKLSAAAYSYFAWTDESKHSQETRRQMTSQHRN
ncbi:MAG: hypothetical protein DHS20C05_04190 [Hyphococcus sp.]|nr:MAG: hypothetical protein DHS20C05_04190 [Marinicaulis sp.]